MITGVQTARADGLDVSAFKVWDEFLNRIQIRMLTASEYHGINEWKVIGDFNFAIVIRCKSYGSKEWRGKK